MISPLIKKIKEKKEFHSLDDAFVQSQIELFLKRNQKLAAPVLKQKQFKVIVKGVRADLRKLVVYASKENIPEIGQFKGLKKEEFKKLCQNIIQQNTSTKERFNIYSSIYQEIKKLKPKRILDLGCGLNPVSLSLSNWQGEYFAYDVNQEEISFLQRFFPLLKDIAGIKGQASSFNLSEIEKIPFLPKADLCLLFKVTDVLEQKKYKKHKITEELLQKLPCRFILLSFSTKTLSGKPMTAPERNWLKWLLERLKYQYRILSYPSEIFYLIDKETGQSKG